MTDLDVAIDLVVSRTGVERYRWLCSDANTLPAPNSADDWRRWVLLEAAKSAGEPARRYPPPATQASNLARSLWDWAVGGFLPASEEEQARRLAICNACEWFDAGRCRACGCIMTLKVPMKTARCPIDKW